MDWPGLWQQLNGPWEALLFLAPLYQGLSKPGRAPAVSKYRSGFAALGLHGLYGLLSGLALPSPEDCNCSQGNLWSFMEVPAGPWGIVLIWEAQFLFLSTRLPTGSFIPEKPENQGSFKLAFRIPLSFYSQD